MSAPSEAERVAARLDVAEQSAMGGRIVHISSRVLDRLVARGLVSRERPNWTPLGLEVRAILQSTNRAEEGGENNE